MNDRCRWSSSVHRLKSVRSRRRLRITISEIRSSWNEHSEIRSPNAFWSDVPKFDLITRTRNGNELNLRAENDFDDGWKILNSSCFHCDLVSTDSFRSRKDSSRFFKFSNQNNLWLSIINRLNLNKKTSTKKPQWINLKSERDPQWASLKKTSMKELRPH